MSHVIFSCTYCLRCFFKVETVKEHLESSRLCKDNGASYKEEIKELWDAGVSSDIARRMAQSNTQDKFVCIECGSSFFNRGHMKTHMRQGHPTKPMVFHRVDLTTGKTMIFDETPQGQKASRRFFDGDKVDPGDEGRERDNEKTEGTIKAKDGRGRVAKAPATAVDVDALSCKILPEVKSISKATLSTVTASKPTVISASRLASLPILHPGGTPVTSLPGGVKILSAASLGAPVKVIKAPKVGKGSTDSDSVLVTPNKAPTRGIRLSAADLKAILARQKNGEKITIQSLKEIKNVDISKKETRIDEPVELSETREKEFRDEVAPKDSTSNDATLSANEKDPIVGDGPVSTDDAKTKIAGDGAKTGKPTKSVTVEKGENDASVVSGPELVVDEEKSSLPPKKQKVSRYIIKDGKLMTEDGCPAPMGKISGKLAKNLMKAMEANKKKEALGGDPKNSEAVSTLVNPIVLSDEGDNSNHVMPGSSTNPPTDDSVRLATVHAATLPSVPGCPHFTSISVPTSPTVSASSLPTSTAAAANPKRAPVASDANALKSRVIKVPVGCSPEDIKKLLSAQLGTGVKIQVKNQSSGSINAFTALENSQPGISENKQHSDVKNSMPNDDSIEITKVVTNPTVKSSTGKKSVPTSSKKIQLPVDRVLMMPKNHRYLHPKFQPLVKLRRYSAQMIRKLINGETLIVKGRRKITSINAPTAVANAPWRSDTSNAPWMTNSIPKIFSADSKKNAPDPKSSLATPKSATKCCPVCMAAYADAESLRSHIKTEHNVEPFGYVEMDVNGAPTNFVPFDALNVTQPPTVAPPTTDNSAESKIIDAESKRKTLPLDSSSDESVEEPKLTIDSFKAKKKRLTKKRSHAARVKRSRHSSSSSTSLSFPPSSSDDLDDSENNAERAKSPTSPSPTKDSYPAGSTFTCTVCNETFKDISTFRAHSRRVHAIRTDRRGGVSCLVSDPVAGTTELVRLKTAAASPTKVPSAQPTHTFTCTICYEVFKDIDFIRMHIRNQHKATKITYLKNDLKTGVTDMVTEAGIVSHATSKFDYFCTFCRAKFFSISGLRQHCHHLHNVSEFRYEYRDTSTGKLSSAKSFSFRKVDEALKKSGYKTNMAAMLTKSRKCPEELSD